MNLKVVKTQKEEKNCIELFVEAPVQLSEKSYSLALRNISESINIPGFRKGKAPREMIEKQVGVGYISQKAFESVFYDIINTASSQEKIDILNVLEISSFELLPGKPLTFKAVVELKPEVKLGKYKNLKVKAKKIVYNKEKFILKTLEKIANNFISYQKVTNRKVKEGDLVTLDFEGKYEDGSEVPGGKAENFQAVLEKDKFLPEFIDKLKGIEIGDTKEISITFPETYSKDLASKKAIFKVKVNSLEEKVFPEINDDFAKKLGLENLEALKNKIVDQMIELQNIASERELENNLVEQIVKSSKFEISDSMVNKEIDFLLKDMKIQCEKEGISWNDFKSNDKNKELIEKAREAGLKRIGIDLILSAIVNKENIEASGDEIEREIENRIAQLGEKFKNLKNDKTFKNTVELIILRNKAVDFLIKHSEPVWEEEVVSAPSE